MEAQGALTTLRRSEESLELRYVNRCGDGGFKRAHESKCC